jgi:hypothetical protein
MFKKCFQSYKIILFNKYISTENSDQTDTMELSCPPYNNNQAFYSQASWGRQLSCPPCSQVFFPRDRNYSSVLFVQIFLLWTCVPFLNDFVNFNNRNIYISRKCPYHILCETIYRRNFPSLLFRMAGVGDTWISCNKRSSFKVAFDVLVHFSCSCVKLRKPNKMGPQIHLLKGSHAVG